MVPLTLRRSYRIGPAGKPQAHRSKGLISVLALLELLEPPVYPGTVTSTPLVVHR